MKILAVCGFGVGSSMVLKMTIEKVCKELGIQADVETMDVSGAQGEACDYIFTSQELGNELSKKAKCPVIPIKRYMDQDEVRTKFEEVLNKK